MKQVLFAVLLFTMIFMTATSSVATAPLKVTYLDVGQGDSILLRTPNGKNILIDGGDDRSDPCDRVILPYLKKNGIRELDCVIVSHAHRDHIGGLLELLRKFPVKEVIEAQPTTTQMYKDLLKIIAEKKIKLTKGYQGDILRWDPTCKAEILHPPRLWTTKKGMEYTTMLSMAMRNIDDASPQSSNLNNYSIVLKVRHGDVTYLFAGDAEEEAEREMTNNNPANSFGANVYKASHHGSKTSSSPEFLKIVKPDHVIVCVGEGNQFGHPHAVTLKNLSYYTKNIYRTDKNKTIESWSDGKKAQFAFEGSENTMVASPTVSFSCHDTVTLQWTTSRPSDTKLEIIGLGEFSHGEDVQEHFITINQLKPSTTYQYKISSEVRNGKQKGTLLSSEGSFTTLAAPSSSGTINSTSMLPAPYVGEESIVTIKANGGDKIRIYDKTLHTNFLLQTIPLKDGEAIYKWTPTIHHTGPLYVQLEKGNRTLAVKKIETSIKKRLVLIDEAHENYGHGSLEALRLNLSFAGFNAMINSKPFTATALKKAAVVIITEPEKGIKFTAAEVKAVKSYLDGGGSILMVSQSDYKDNSNPAVLNKLLDQTASNLRFNDDQTLDPVNCSSANSPWNLTPRDFDYRIVSKEVKRVLAMSGCSLLTGEYQPIKKSDSLFRLMYTSNQGKNQDSDNQGDAVMYPSDIPVVIDAGEILPSGAKIALFGAPHLFRSAFTVTSENQTGLYNTEVIRWLSRPGKLRIKELAHRLTRGVNQDTDRNRAAEGIAQMRQETSQQLVERFDSMDVQEALPELVALLNESSLEEKRQMMGVLEGVLQRIRYQLMHNENLLEQVKNNLNQLDEIQKTLELEEKY